jgi:hypothetical protein
MIVYSEIERLDVDRVVGRPVEGCKKPGWIAAASAD